MIVAIYAKLPLRKYLLNCNRESLKKKDLKKKITSNIWVLGTSPNLIFEIKNIDFSKYIKIKVIIKIKKVLNMVFSKFGNLRN